MIHNHLTKQESYTLLNNILAQNNFKESTPYNPLMIALEITTSCNLKCIRCERRAIDPIHLNHHMSEKTFEKLSSLFRYVRGVSIVGGLGEPLLAPNFWMYVSQIKDSGAQVQYFTNGSRWDDKAMVKTFEMDVDVAVFSIDSFSPENYERLKTGAEYHHSIDRIETFLRLRKETGGKTKLMLNCAIQKDTLDEMLPLLQFSSERGIDKIWYTGVITHLEEQVPYSHLTLPLSMLKEFFDKISEEAKRLGIPVRLPASELKKQQVCVDLWTNLYIFYNGDICACPHFRESKTYFYHVLGGKNIINEERVLPDTILGNAHNVDALSLWDGLKHREMRRKMLSGNPDKPCRECHFSYDLH